MMKSLNITFILGFVCLLASLIPTVSAEMLITEFKTHYPDESYILGIGEKEQTGNKYADKRVAEILARLEIARQIKVKIHEVTVDVACEGAAATVFTNTAECRNKFFMIIKQSVDEVLEGSKIVDYGERDGSIYAVAVLPRKKAVEDMERYYSTSIIKAKASVEDAREGDTLSLQRAEEEYAKAVAYFKGKEVVGRVKNNATKALKELHDEVVRLKRKDQAKNE